jgi:hypothetical protein
MRKAKLSQQEAKQRMSNMNVQVCAQPAAHQHLMLFSSTTENYGMQSNKVKHIDVAVTEAFPDPDVDRELIPCETVPFPKFKLYRKALENVEFELTQVGDRVTHQ